MFDLAFNVQLVYSLATKVIVNRNIKYNFFEIECSFCAD